MKALLLSFIGAFALLFSACSKEEPVIPFEDERYSITLNVSTLSHDIVPMASLNPTNTKLSANSTGKKLSDVINFISYAVYDDKGSRIVHKFLHVSELGFGTIKEVLSKGKYKVLLIGGIHVPSELPRYYNDNAGINSQTHSEDIFFGQVDLVVSGSNIEQNIELKRKVGKLVVELTDQVPLNVGEIQYSIEGVSQFFIPKTNRGENNITITKSMAYQSDGSPYEWDLEPFTIYFFLDKDQEKKVNVTLIAFDRDQNVVAEKVIENVPVGINRKTVVRGRLFDTDDDMPGQKFSFGF